LPCSITPENLQHLASCQSPKYNTSHFLSGLLWSTASKTSVCRYCTAVTGSVRASSSNRCRLSRYRQSCRSVEEDRRHS